MTKYTKEWYKSKYAERLRDAHAYLGGKCFICGSVDVLEIHHKNPEEKSFTVTEQLHGMAWAKVLLELDKCVLVCDYHHKKIHEAVCGTISMYRRGCRCVYCKEALRDYMREYRKRIVL